MPIFDFAIKAVQEIFLANWYWLLPLSTFLEELAIIGFVSPGVVTVILGGYYAGTGQLPWHAIFILAFIGTILGDIANYKIGQTVLGKRFENWLPENKKSLLLEKINRQAKWFLLFYHFSGYGRAFVPLIAGAVRMPFTKWLKFAAAGAFLWTIFLVILGYISGKYAHDLFSQYKILEWIFIVFFVFWLGSLIFFIWRLKKS